jgi:PncC family amidohydrolase
MHGQLKKEVRMHHALKQLANDVTACLRSRSCRIVLAESCTGGLISAALAQIPGVSDFHCGSAVVYRLDTKTKWLGISPTILIDPGPVSDVVARLMATGVLHRTPEADWAAAVTGHLGPNAPTDQDGLVYIAVSRKDASQSDGAETVVQAHRVGDPLPDGMSPEDSLRERRQVRAAELVLQSLLNALQQAQ